VLIVGGACMQQAEVSVVNVYCVVVHMRVYCCRMVGCIVAFERPDAAACLYVIAGMQSIGMPV